MPGGQPAESCCSPGGTGPLLEQRAELFTTLRFLALGDEVTVVSPNEMEKSEKGEVRGGMKMISVLPGLSFRLSIQLWMSLRQAEIQVETCVSDGGKERKSWVSSA